MNRPDVLKNQYDSVLKVSTMAELTSSDNKKSKLWQNQKKETILI